MQQSDLSKKKIKQRSMVRGNISVRQEKAEEKEIVA